MILRALGSLISQIPSLQRAPSFIKGDTVIQSLARKTDEIIRIFKRQGLFEKYCGQFTLYNYLTLMGRKPQIPELLGSFDLGSVNQNGSRSSSLQRALTRSVSIKPTEARSLSARDIEVILSGGKPIAALLKGDDENHWVTLVGYDDSKIYALDYNEVKTYDRAAFPESFLTFIYHSSKK